VLLLRLRLLLVLLLLLLLLGADERRSGWAKRGQGCE
jgi:hypothetical protein